MKQIRLTLEEKRKVDDDLVKIVFSVIKDVFEVDIDNIMEISYKRTADRVMALNCFKLACLKLNINRNPIADFLGTKNNNVDISKHLNYITNYGREPYKKFITKLSKKLAGYDAGIF